MVPQQHRRRRRRVALARTAERRLVVARGAGGFGFTIAGQRPCVVSAVATGGMAERAGLRAGDALLAVDGASVARASHAAVARLVAAAPQAIALSVAPRDSQPTDTEDTEPDERARTRRRHPPPRRRPQQPPLLHHPGCHAAPSTSGVNEILQNLTRAQLSPSSHASSLECRAVVGYLGTIETPRASSETPPGSVKTAVRRLRQEKRPAAPVLLSVFPNVLILRRPTGQTLAQYVRERIVYAGCSSDADRRYFGLVTSAAELTDEEVSHSCHVFAVDPRLSEHDAHVSRAREFQISCTRDPVAERCLEFPPSAEYVVGVIKGMYSLPAEECSSPALQQISKLVKGESPAANFSRNNRVALRMPRYGRRQCNHEENGRLEPQEFVANSPQPSNHSEITTTSSNSDSGIGFHNDGRNIADRILVVDFAGPQPFNRCRSDVPRRPIGLVGSFEDGSFLSNTTPVVDGFAGQGRPLNHLEDVMLNPNDLQNIQGRFAPSPNKEDHDSYNYNNAHYMNVPSTSRMNGLYDQVYTESESHYELIPPLDYLDVDRVTETFNSVEIYEEKVPEMNSNEDNMTVVSGVSKASMDSLSIYSTRSHEDPRPSRLRHMQASLDDMLVIGREEREKKKDDDNFVHPGTVKCKVRKSKGNILTRTKLIFSKDKDREHKKNSANHSRALSASAGDVCGAAGGEEGEVLGAVSEPDLSRQSEQSSPFRRWTTGSGAGSSYRHHDHRNIYNKQMSEGTPPPNNGGGGGNGGGGVARWSLGLEALLGDPAGAAAFAHFLGNEFAAENIRFWWSCEQYNNCQDPNTRQSLAREIWQRHLAEGAPEPVNVDAGARRAAAAAAGGAPPAADLFLQAQKQIFNVMKFDSYPRFLRSGVHAECARADLRGLPPPYATRQNLEPETTKLKKSASNASERRRSGGASLLPWRLRAGAKERAASTNNVHATVEHSHQILADVVKSNPTVGCSLCRVVLPDGATSVVGVDAALSVRALVDKLLQRRSLHCPSYDVLLRDEQGENPARVIDSAAPSTALGGREARVERRCVVRLELQGRCVAVRCRPGRRLSHALSPVLARYCAGAAAAVCRQGARVPPDTLMQELDGMRLQVIPTERGPVSFPAGADSVCIEPDTDSLSELPTRLADDGDAQSATSSARGSDCGSSCSGSQGGPGSQGLYGSQGGQGSQGLYGSQGGQGSQGLYGSQGGPGGQGAGGRVRAALRPGPPLHHHPPDFLENLRETQRIRLQNRPEVETRSPPPLPPKPRAAHAPAALV